MTPPLLQSQSTLDPELARQLGLDPGDNRGFGGFGNDGPPPPGNGPPVFQPPSGHFSGGFSGPRDDDGPPPGGRYTGGFSNPRDDDGPPPGGHYTGGFSTPRDDDGPPPPGGHYTGGFSKSRDEDGPPPAIPPPNFPGPGFHGGPPNFPPHGPPPHFGPGPGFGPPPGPGFSSGFGAPANAIPPQAGAGMGLPQPNQSQLEMIKELCSVQSQLAAAQSQLVQHQQQVRRGLLIAKNISDALNPPNRPSGLCAEGAGKRGLSVFCTVRHVAEISSL